MPAPSVPFTTIPASDLDPDSPITTELMTSLYENALFAVEWQGQRANAQINHRHRGLGTDGTDAVQWSDIGSPPVIPNPVAGMQTWTGAVVEGAGAQVVFGTASVIGFWPVALLMNVAVRMTGPGGPQDTINWIGRSSGSNAGHYLTINGGVVAVPFTGQWFGGAVAFEPLTGAALVCLTMGAPGMAATFQWNGPVPVFFTRTTSITLTAIGQ